MKEKLKRSLSPEDLRGPDDVLQLKGRHIPLSNNVTYLGVIFNRRMTWRYQNEITVAKALSIYVSSYFLSGSGRLNTNIKLTIYKALIRSVMTHVAPLWDYAVNTHLLKLQLLQN
jgi:hypothetical protein